MAINYCRLEFVKRSEGKNACCKSAYNGRSRIYFEGTNFQESKLYNFSNRSPSAYHQILLPDHVSSKFQAEEYLWNSVEKVENRKNSQVAIEVVLALPDDKIVSLEDKIELTKTFAQENFVSKGFGVQVDIHHPEVIITSKNGSKEVIEGDHNWHAHILVTTRRFDESGQLFEKNKPRDLFPQVKKGRVTEGNHWSSIWEEHQNRFFKEKGYDLVVDKSSIVPQKHLGPKRMRGKAQSLIEENELRKELNVLESLDAGQVLSHITKHQSVFTYECVEFYILKNVPQERQDAVRADFWKKSEIIQLFSRFQNKPQPVYTTQAVLQEERQIFRIASRIKEHKSRLRVSNDSTYEFSKHLNPEQTEAYTQTLLGGNFICINGSAGTGKSTLLSAIKDTYQDSGIFVRGLGPDFSTASVLNEKGFDQSENIHKFLFNLKHGNRAINERNEVWIVDEASKISNPSLLELLKIAEKNKVKVILCGDTSQYNPVERGEMFQHFCKQFSSLNLKDIQRQADTEQREIAKLWAEGKASKAIDLISKNGDFIWSQNKATAIKELVRSWACDQALNQGSHLILAQKREEIQVLNDVIRLYKKKTGELGEKDYLCKTSQGAFVVSTGDLIEFRRNDKELGVSNGSYGVLTKASPNQFIVKILGESQERNVSFDPNSYTYFNLGYATTSFRSQGRTVDRSYLLHSPQMRLDSHYIGFTRHRHQAKCFISTTECENISKLKNLATRAKKLDSTLKYLSAEEVDWKNKILSYSQSDSYIKQAYGYGLRALSKVDIFKKFSDRKSNEAFYNPHIDAHQKGKVQEVTGNEATPVRVITNRVFFQDKNDERYQLIEKIEEVNPVEVADHLHQGFESGNIQALKENKEITIERTVDGSVINVNQLAEEIHQEVRNLVTQLDSNSRASSNASQEKTPQQEAYRALETHKQTILKDYFSKSKESRELYQIVKSESETKGVNRHETTLSSEWKKSTAMRNEAAYNVKRSLTLNELERVFRKDTLGYLNDYAERHQNYIDRAKDRSPRNTEIKLKDNVEALCYQLFPEGPSSKGAGALRFRGKGSLKVMTSGPNQGSFVDFENDAKGGMISLIQHTQGLSFKEALNWSHEFLGDVTSIHVPNHFSAPKNQKENEWTSLTPQKDSDNPSLLSVNKSLASKFEETARYCYTDEKGSLLFYTLRLESKSNGEKKVLPLSYGFSKERPGWKHWEIRGYQSDLKPLYRLDQLYKRPEAPVLIVEGEKTADAAQELLKEYVVISWLGGSNSASKADWRHLNGRDVHIWPDNDFAGFKASNEVSKELRKVGVNSLKVVDHELLHKSLPKKWDLADQLPESLPKSFIKDSILNARESCVSVDSVMKIIGQRSDNYENHELRSMVTDLLAIVDSRLRPNLEQKYGQKTWDINREITKEVVNILVSKESVSQELCKRGILGEVNERLTSISLRSKAKRGIGLASEEIENYRKILKEHGNNFVDKHQILSDNYKLMSLYQNGTNFMQDKQLFKEVIEKESNKLSFEGTIKHFPAQNYTCDQKTFNQLER